MATAMPPSTMPITIGWMLTAAMRQITTAGTNQNQ